MKYKFLREVDGQIKSNSGDTTWTVGEWQTHRGKLDICNSGLHCSDQIWQAFSYVQGEILAEVEVGGRSVIQDDKSCWSKMRLTKCYRWRKEDSVALALFAAESVLELFEKQYPEDKRPRQAIEAARVWLKDPSEENKDAARAAARAAAWAAGAAAWAAEDAAWAARDAAWAAGAAAWAAGAAARAARAAAEDAAWAAARAAGAAFLQRAEDWMQERIKELPEYDA